MKEFERWIAVVSFFLFFVFFLLGLVLTGVFVFSRERLEFGI